MNIMAEDHTSRISLPISELDAFPVVSLEDLARVTLLNRVDSKYIFHYDELGGLLNELSKE
jgi:hypothetical protein